MSSFRQAREEGGIGAAAGGVGGEGAAADEVAGDRDSGGRRQSFRVQVAGGRAALWPLVTEEMGPGAAEEGRR